MKSLKKFAPALIALLILLSAVSATAAGYTAESPQEDNKTATPIKHLVVIFQENVSFDHYFATYPNALNPANQPKFKAAPDTPSVNGLNQNLLTNNPNAANPRRLDRSEAITCDQDHNYTDEQKAYNHGFMDKFVESVSGSGCQDKSLVMDYYDGNTTTALWNYAQRFSMSDNFFGTSFGPSTPGAINLTSGQTHGATPATLTGEVTHGTIIGDPRPLYDDCSKGDTVEMSGRNIGDLLNGKHITWGWFQGGFKPTATENGKAVCGAAHQNIGGATVNDYIPHHEPFQYYKSTANPHHLPPTSTAMIGKTDQANHQYDLADFWAASNAGDLPAVSFLKASAYQDGHAGYSGPLDEQNFLVDTVNKLQRLPAWKDTAVIISYDDSDGWYDHVMGPIVNQSNTDSDALTGPGQCGMANAGAYQARCGYGPRLPLLVLSAYAKRNFVDHSITDQTSILRFIEDNWTLGRIGDQSLDAQAGSLGNMLDFSHRNNDKLFLDPSTGLPTSGKR